MTGILKVLMLKHLVVRVRRFVHTGVEVISPAVFFIILYIFKDYIKQPVATNALDAVEVYKPDPVRLSDVTRPRLVFYTPDTNLTEQLMDKVGENLHLSRLESFPVGLAGRGYYPIANASMLEDFISNMDDTQALVVFQNVSDKGPNILNYTIRVKRDFKTHLYFALDGSMEPHQAFGLIYDTFLRLQWAIDTSYLHLKGLDVKQNVTLQEFPFVKTNHNMNTVITLLVEALKVLCWLSLLLVFVFLVARLLDERTTGVEELMKIAGVSGNSLVVSHLLNVLPAGLVYCLVNSVLLTASSSPLLVSAAPLIALMLLLHFTSVVVYAFVCSYLLKSSQYAVTLSMFAYTLLWIPARMVSGRQLSYFVLPLTGLLPHRPMQIFWDELAILEKFGIPLTFSNMSTPHGDHCISAMLCLMFLTLQCLIFTMVASYLEAVNPGPYGHPLPWNFLFKRSFWYEEEVTPDSEVQELAETITNDPLYFEEPPKDLKPGIKIRNVSQVFGRNVVLSDVSLDIYKGEITVLLGHNGAGKTTLMNIITGMMCATSGEVLVEGLHTVLQEKGVRKMLGFCPQHNLFFSDLTVLEHVMFFTMIKGFSYHQAKVESKQLLEKLGLGGKENSSCAQLSGGMRRRLQLACALAGGSRVLVLDEPTSGLDVETRRELWDLLLSLRGARTVLLTTHFMEEADALGDRVAALHAGKLRCHATTMHLKRALGTGYRLSFTTIGIPKEAAITDTVRSVVSDASMREQSLNSIAYNLPAKDTTKFPELFQLLECKRSELAIDSIGVGISTLEEVFLKLCSDVETTFTEDTVDSAALDAEYEKVTGAMLYWRQLQVLLKRQFKYMMSKKLSILILQVIMPIVTLIMITYVTVEVQPTAQCDLPMAMDLDIYDWRDLRVLYRINTSDASLLATREHYSDVYFEPTCSVIDSLVEYGKQDIIEYSKYVAGIEINDTDAVVLYSTLVRHAAPVALNLLVNMLANEPVQTLIETLNQPLLDTKPGSVRTDLVQPKSLIMAVMWATGVVFVVLATNINLVSLPCKERESGARHLHVLSGCPPALHWAGTLVAHTALCTLTLLLPALAVAATCDAERTLTQPDFLGAMFVVLLLGSLAFFAFMYLVSFYFGERGASSVLVACIIIFAFLTTSMKKATDFFKEKQELDFYYYALVLCGWVAPPHTFTIAAMKAVNVARLNAYCVLNRERCPALFVTEDGFDVLACCQLNRNPRCYFCIDEYSPGEPMIIMLCQFVVFMILVILTQYGVFNRLADRLFNRRYSPRVAPADDLVRAEATYVSKADTLPPDQIQEAMLVDDVHKNYIQFFRKSTNAVKGVSFSVKKGECFGLLGVNGAGKSTTFKMLTGEQCPTRGNVFANGHHMDRDRNKYLRSLGYCPQFSGLDEFQSGQDNLELVLTLRGLPAQHVKLEADSWIEIVGLEQYKKRLVSRYSGGMSRRLCAAAALCGGARVALLDEPTAGVDVAARRRVWAAIRHGLAKRRATLVTSHSMDEMEALCSRIAIMSHGRIRALGSAAALRAAHASGHAVQLKLRPLAGTDDPAREVHRLQEELLQMFNCELKDQHKTMLHYHINDTLRYSELFVELEALKRAHPIIEDYSVSETTLEEVFLSFAKEPGDLTVRATPV